MTDSAKVLNLTNLDAENAILDEQYEAQITSPVSGEVFTLWLDKHFRKTKVMDMIAEIMTQVQYARQNEIDVNTIFVQYSIFMLIKHFTSFGKEAPVGLSEQIQVLNKFTDLGLLEPIMEIFNIDEVSNIFDQISVAITELDDKMEEIDARLEEIKREMIEREANFEVDTSENTE